MKIFIVIIMILGTFYLTATIINVPADYDSIQAGIDVSVDGDTVLVQPGTYYENINFSGKSISVVSLFFPTQDTSYIPETIIDGTQNGSVVLFNSGEDSLTVLAGFTIQNGSGFMNYYSEGGGIRITNNSSPVLHDLEICYNSARWGGGIFISDSSPVMDHLKIRNNSGNDGGGIYISNSHPEILNSKITYNYVSSYGGGIRMNDSYPFIENLSITDNTAEAGGGINYRVTEQHDTYHLTGITLKRNIAGDGGGINIHGGNEIIEDCLIKDNIAFNQGGGISYSGYDDGILNRLEISGNYALQGAGISCSSNLEISNCTLCENQGLSAVEVRNHFTINTINTIFCNFTECEINLVDDFSVLYMLYSDLPGGEDSIASEGVYYLWDGNIFCDPLFNDPENGDYTLSSISPCLNSGIAYYEWYNWTVFEFEGEYIGSAPDMGCYEALFNAIEDEDIEPFPTDFYCYPNPFNPVTQIVFTMMKKTDVKLAVYNLKGQLMQVLVEGMMEAGKHSIVWDGQSAGSGIYLAKLQKGKDIVNLKMILIK